MKTAKEIADNLDAEERLTKRGYTKKECNKCNGLGFIKTQNNKLPFSYPCYACCGSGFSWMPPIIK